MGEYGVLFVTVGDGEEAGGKWCRMIARSSFWISAGDFSEAGVTVGIDDSGGSGWCEFMLDLYGHDCAETEEVAD